MSDLTSTDPVTRDTLGELASLPGPWATITLPTARTGPQVSEGPHRFRLLARRALELLGELDADGLDWLAVQFDDLRADHAFWAHQADGLVVLASAHGIRTFRLATPLPEGVRVAWVPGLTELALHLDAGDVWFIVAVSHNQVRLLRSTEHSVEQLPLEGIPGSFDEAVGDLERQEHLSWTARPGGGANFHGLGGGAENDKVWLEKYLRRVAQGLDAHSSRPGEGMVVLAGVEALVASLRAIWRPSGLIPASVRGNPDHMSVGALHAAALPLVRAERQRREDALLERLGATGQHDLAAILRAAAEGRIAELALGPSVDHLDRAAADPAIRATVMFGGSVVPLHDLREPMAALTRY